MGSLKKPFLSPQGLEKDFFQKKRKKKYIMPAFQKEKPFFERTKVLIKIIFLRENIFI